MEQTEQVQSLRRSFTRLARFINQLMREQLAASPITPQQCYALEALLDGPRSMKSLAAEVGLHQSTVTRIVEKLERLELARRYRQAENQRVVMVELCELGRQVHAACDRQADQIVAEVMALIPSRKRARMVDALETMAGLLDPESEAFQRLLGGCCCGPREGADR